MNEVYKKYFDLLREWNEKFNLTAILEESAVETLHFEDSKAGASLLNNNASVLDIGSGAGFPGMVLAIERPDCRFALLEATAKKCGFLKEVVKTLGLVNVEIANARAEDYAATSRIFDVVTARAVAGLPKLLKWAAPFVKQGGLFLAWKTDDAELKSAEPFIKKFKFEYVGKNKYIVAGRNRVILKFCKA